MGLGRTWARACSGAVGAAVVVPLGLLLAVALAATVGGGGLGGLGQLVRGPSLPDGGPIAQALDTGAGGATGGVPAVPRVTLDEARGSGSSGGGARPGSSSDGPRKPSTGAKPGGSDPSQPTDDGPDPPTGTTSPAATPTPGAPTSPTPTPEPQQDPVGEIVRGAGSVADQAVRPLPVVGEPAADAVATVIDLVAPPRAAPAQPVVPAITAVTAP